ncbi:MAG: Do family serine endopeptidase [Syntrophobacteraceae bacterium]
MFGRIGNSFNKKRFGINTIVLTAVFFVLAGFTVSARFNVLGSAVAESTALPLRTSAKSFAESPFTPLVEMLTPSVVNVKVSKVEKADFPFQQMPGNPFGQFFNSPGFPQNRPVQGAGSGVIISSDGYILTNNHVVEGAKEVEVTLNDRKEFKAQIIGLDPKTDLAIVKIDAGRSLPAANIGDSSALRVGDWVLAIGNPFGLNQTVTSGIVSAKGRVIGAGPYDDFIQTDASINPGNSGGPLFNMNGEVVGINTAIIAEGQGIGFAIPINTAKPLIPQLEAKGEVTRGYLGVNIQTVTPELAAALHLKDAQGALVAEVLPGGPADKAGISRGDLIISFDANPVKDSHDLPVLVAATPVDKEVPIIVVRNGKDHQISARIAKLESEGTKRAKTKTSAQSKLGLQIQDLDSQTARQLGIDSAYGVVVVNVQPGSPAERASIQQGDAIVEVNRRVVKSASDLREEIAKVPNGDGVLLLVKNRQGSRYVVVKEG